jgi:hypothetical protein
LQQKKGYVKTTIAFSTLLLLTISSYTITESFSTSSNRGINWADMCRLADALISEPCRELVNSNNPYKLTSEGERVLNCIGGGALALATGHPELLSLGPSVGCGGGSSHFSSNSDSRYSSRSNDDPIGNLLSNLFGSR